MPLDVTCFYCGHKKSVQIGEVVKLACDKCASAKVVLRNPAVFRCALCGETFRYPADQRVTAYHDKPRCLGRALILMDYE